ncbi:glycyl-radical enzyme activating protein [bacterium]|nr:glycyl-radical enzyme activating protein [bacterium]
MPQSGIIFNIKRYAIHDGPGIRTTVFLKGCPLRCVWCHNPESIATAREHMFRAQRCLRCDQCVDACPTGALEAVGSVDIGRCTLCGACSDACPSRALELMGRQVTVAEVMDEVERDIVFYDRSGGGATLSGGEPLLQPEFATALLAACRERGIHTALDTTCFAPWATIEAVRPHVCLFLCDVKHMDSAEHQRLTGVPNETILDNIRRLAAIGENVILRVPLIPGANDSSGNITATGAFAVSLRTVEHVHLLPYNEGGRAKAERLAGTGDVPDFERPSAEDLATAADRLRTLGLTVRTGG